MQCSWYNGDLHTLEELTSSGVDVTGIVYDRVNMCVAIQHSV